MNLLSVQSAGGGDPEAAAAAAAAAASAAMRWRDPNLTEVISFLNNPNNVIKANAAAYLQHLCYMDDPNKQRTRTLGGIPPLVKLLAHDGPEVRCCSVFDQCLTLFGLKLRSQWGQNFGKGYRKTRFKTLELIYIYY